MNERLSNLLTVKSIVTIILTLVFSILCIRGIVTGNEFLTVYVTIIAFYYGTQRAKNDKSNINHGSSNE